jgi:hypothetical protein
MKTKRNEMTNWLKNSLKVKLTSKVEMIAIIQSISTVQAFLQLQLMKILMIKLITPSPLQQM